MCTIFISLLEIIIATMELITPLNMCLDGGDRLDFWEKYNIRRKKRRRRKENSPNDGNEPGTQFLIPA